jgi:uncharacterized protein (DUF488 family)
LVDVRSFPTSKIDHFKQEKMKIWLKKAGIEYVWLGRELGGYRTGGYEKHMETDLFKMGINKLLELAKNKRVCICCMERDPKWCHRRFITRRLLELGVTVRHILKRGKVYEAVLLA